MYTYILVHAIYPIEMYTYAAKRQIQECSQQHYL